MVCAPRNGELALARALDDRGRHVERLRRVVAERAFAAGHFLSFVPRLVERPLHCFARALVDERGLAQVSDSFELEQAVRQVLETNPAAVADYTAGKISAINFLKGQVMKSTRGKANPTVAEDLLRHLLAD